MVPNNEMVCYECKDADVSEPSKRITFEPCGHTICYACMIEAQADHIQSTTSIGKRMKCFCGVKVDEHVWHPDADGEIRMPHSDPKLDPRLDGPRICMKQVKEKCNEHGKDHVLGRRGLLHTTQMSIPASGGIETIESNSFELSANGDWLPTPNDGKRCILGCALMHSAVHPLSSTKKDASDDRSSSSMWNQNDDDHAEDGDEDNEGNDINGGETRSEFDVTDIVGILNFAVMEDKTLMPRLLYALATNLRRYIKLNISMSDSKFNFY